MGRRQSHKNAKIRETFDDFCEKLFDGRHLMILYLFFWHLTFDRFNDIKFTLLAPHI